MKILVDTNVILDVLFEREPFVAHSSSIMGRVERRTLNGILCATTLTHGKIMKPRSLPAPQTDT